MSQRPLPPKPASPGDNPFLKEVTLFDEKPLSFTAIRKQLGLEKNLKPHQEEEAT